MDCCAFCHSDAQLSHLYVSFVSQGPPQFHICSACYLVAIRHGYAVVYRDRSEVSMPQSAVA
jgi:hypothetical protein